MSEEEGDDVFSKIEEIQKKHNKLLEENNRQMKAFGDKIGIAIGFGGNVRGSSAMGATSQTIIRLLEETPEFPDLIIGIVFNKFANSLICLIRIFFGLFIKKISFK